MSTSRLRDQRPPGRKYYCRHCIQQGRKRISCIRVGQLHLCLPCTIAEVKQRKAARGWTCQTAGR